MGASIDRQFHVMTRLLRANYSAFYRRIERAPRIRSSTDNRPLLTLTVIYGDGERLPTWIAYLLVKLAIRGSIHRAGTDVLLAIRRRYRASTSDCVPRTQVRSPLMAIEKGIFVVVAPEERTGGEARERSHLPPRNDKRRIKITRSNLMVTFKHARYHFASCAAVISRSRTRARAIHDGIIVTVRETHKYPASHYRILPPRREIYNRDRSLVRSRNECTRERSTPVSHDSPVPRLWRESVPLVINR